MNRGTIDCCGTCANFRKCSCGPAPLAIEVCIKRVSLNDLWHIQINPYDSPCKAFQHLNSDHVYFDYWIDSIGLEHEVLINSSHTHARWGMEKETFYDPENAIDHMIGKGYTPIISTQLNPNKKCNCGGPYVITMVVNFGSHHAGSISLKIISLIKKMWATGRVDHFVINGGEFHSRIDAIGYLSTHLKE